MIISERIFKILKDKNMTQMEFAKRAGFSNSAISDWKRKKTNPSAEKIMDICYALDVTPEQLLTGVGIDDANETPSVSNRIHIDKADPFERVNTIKLLYPILISPLTHLVENGHE